MIQLDLIKGIESFKKYFPYILSIILLLLLLVKCNNTSELKLENKQLKSRVESQKVKLKKEYEQKIEKQNKAFQKTIDSYKDTIMFLDNQNIKKQEKIQKLSIENNYLKSSIKRYTTDELVQYYINRYKQPNDVFKTNLGITFKDTLSKRIAIDLADYDFTVKELDLKNEILDNSNRIISSKDTIINNLENQKKNITFVMEEQSLLIDNQDDLIKNQEKIIKRSTRKEKLLKVALPIAIIGGIITGVLIAK